MSGSSATYTRQSDVTDKLKPCPFCGKNTAYFSGVFYGIKFEQWQLVHDDDYCHVTIKTEWNWTKEECVRQWNERMP